MRGVNHWRIVLQDVPAWKAGTFLLHDLKGYSLCRDFEERQDDLCQIEAFLLGWLLAQRPYIAPIPGTTKLTRLEENLAAAELDLGPEELDEITVAASQIQATGERYAPQQLAMVGREAALKA